MEDILKTQQELSALADEVIAALRNSEDPDNVQNIKKLQDMIRSLYERQQYETKDLVKKRRKELELLEEEARAPHQAEFEAARADLEEKQLQLQDLIQDLKSRITEFEKSRKSSMQEMKELVERTREIDRQRTINESHIRMATGIYYQIAPISWAEDNSSFTIFGEQTTPSIGIPVDKDNDFCNSVWRSVDEALGFAW